MRTDSLASKKVYDRYIESVESGEISEQEIKNIRKALSNNHLLAEQADYLVEAVETNKPKIGKDQEAKGYQWLVKQWKTPKGTVRQTSPFSLREELILKEFNYFKLVGLYNVNDTGCNGGAVYADYRPIFRVVSDGGYYFDYTTVADEKNGRWQKLKIITKKRPPVKRDRAPILGGKRTLNGGWLPRK